MGESERASRTRLYKCRTIGPSRKKEARYPTLWIFLSVLLYKKRCLSRNHHDESLSPASGFLSKHSSNSTNKITHCAVLCQTSMRVSVHHPHIRTLEGYAVSCHRGSSGLNATSLGTEPSHCSLHLSLPSVFPGPRIECCRSADPQTIQKIKRHAPPTKNRSRQGFTRRFKT